MRFSELALYLGRLEETSSRNALVGILAELFRRTPPEDVAPTCYLLQGRLAPFFEPIEIGLGQNYMADAVVNGEAPPEEDVPITADITVCGSWGNK